jgi:hypothetical protein
MKDLKQRKSIVREMTAGFFMPMNSLLPGFKSFPHFEARLCNQLRSIPGCLQGVVSRNNEDVTIFEGFTSVASQEIDALRVGTHRGQCFYQKHFY